MATDHIRREDEISFFYKWIDDLNKQIDDSIQYPHLQSDYKVCKTQLMDCIEAIRTFPAADVRPVVRAEWKNEIWLKDENGSLEWHGLCSRCLMTFSTFGVYVKRINFCPNCGADIRGK